MSDVLEVALLPRRAVTQKQRLAEAKRSAMVAKPHGDRPLRKNHRDRQLPLRP
jgi:hypothetical protein